MEENKTSFSRRAFLSGAATIGVAAAAGAALTSCAASPNASAQDDKEELVQTTEADPIAPVDPPESWDKEVDVVVVGTGGGGLSATVYAAEHGETVVAIEKEGRVGGATRHAGGIILPYGGSTAQNEMGYGYPNPPFDPDAALAEIQKYYQYSMNEKMVRSFIVAGGQWADWIQTHDNISFICTRRGFVDKALATHEQNGVLGNNNPINAMEENAKAAGAEILLNTRCEALVSQDGKVIGVKVKDSKNELFIKANKGVILTAGGMGMNRDMLKEYIPAAYRGAVQGGPMPSDTGECIRMGLGMGADMSGFDSFSCWEGGINEFHGHGDGQWWHYFYNGARQLCQNPWLIIDKRGDRVPYFIGGNGASLQERYNMDTFSMGDLSTAAAQMACIGHHAYVIFDDDYPTNVFKLVESGQYVGDESRIPITPADNMIKNDLVTDDWQAEVDEVIERGAIQKADTIEELADLAGLDRKTMVDAVNRWNEICEQGVDTDLSIPYPAEWLIPIKKPPYYCTQTGGAIGKTLCGLRVNEDLQVVNTDGKLIDGLYAGFHTAGGLAGESSYGGQWGNGAISGGAATSWIGGFLACKSLLGE